MFEYAVNKYACLTDVTLQSVASYMKSHKVTYSLSQFLEYYINSESLTARGEAIMLI